MDLATRSGYRCSLADCEASTAGPSDAATDAVNSVGVASHIKGAAPGAPRYDRAQTPAERSDFANGIWLCQTCSRKIDGDVGTWTVDVLKQEKALAELRAKERLGKTMQAVASPGLTPAHQELDRQLFVRLQTMMSEDSLRRALARMEYDNNTRENELEPIHAFLRAVDLDANRFSAEPLNVAVADLVTALDALLQFIAEYFAEYPENQSGDTPLRYSLLPDLNVDRGGRTDREAHAKYVEAAHALSDSIKSVRGAHSRFRTVVRSALVV